MSDKYPAVMLDNKLVSLKETDGEFIKALYPDLAHCAHKRHVWYDNPPYNYAGCFTRIQPVNIDGVKYQVCGQCSLILGEGDEIQTDGD